MRVNYYELLSLDIEFLQLRSHNYNVLKENLIHKIGDLISLKLEDILNYEGINEYFSNDIIKKVHNFGLCFPDETVKPKNYYEIIDGLRTYNIRKKFNVLTAAGKEIEALNVDIKVLSLLPHEYDILKSLKIYTLRDLIRTSSKIIEKYFNISEKYVVQTDSNSATKTQISYNKVIDQVHNLGLSFVNENVIDKSCSTVKIFNTEYFK